MAMSVIGLIELATAFGFEIALIQKAKPDRVHYDTAFTLDLLLAAGGAGLTAGLAYPAADFYGEPRLVPVMWALGAVWLVSGLKTSGRSTSDATWISAASSASSLTNGALRLP